MDTQNENLKLATLDLVEKILERGRLHALENAGELVVKDGGVEFVKSAYVDQILMLAQTEAVYLAEKIIGQDIEVPLFYGDIMEESRTPAAAELAVSHMQQKQRRILADYQNPPKQIMHYQDDPIDLRNFRVDRNKPAAELDGVAGTDELSENEA